MKEQKIVLEIEGMRCPTCAKTIERELIKLRGIIEVNVNFAASKAIVSYNPDEIDKNNIKKTIEKLGYKTRYGALSEEGKKHKIRNQFIVFLIGLALTIPVFVIEVFYYSHEYNFILFLLATPVQFLIGCKFYRGAWISLKNRTANMDVLVALSTSAAYLYSTAATFLFEGHVFYEASTTILTIIYLGNMLEGLAKSRAEEAIKKLISLKPKKATLIKENGEIEVPLEEVKIGDILLVKPGESIPVDGEVVEGCSSVDESMITGESIPVDKKLGDKVIAGTMNKFGVLKIRAERIGGETFLAQMIKLIEEAILTKAPIQRIADRIVGYFVPVVVVISAITFLTWYFLINSSFLFALTNSISVLVIACPCALGLATPTAIMVGMGIGARHGVLIRDASKLELINKANVIVLDKTGTLTKGELEVVKVINEKALELAAIAEKNSEHPIAKAIIKAAENAINPEKIVNPEKFEILPGKGVIAKFNDEEILVGNIALMKDHGIDLGELEKSISSLHEDGITAIIVALNRRVIGVLGLADVLREHSKEVVRVMKELGFEVIMLTGDDRKVASRIARELGIEKFLAEVLPQDKAKEIEKLQELGKIVVMVGDGINDAPALIQSDIGIAMGSAADITKSAGDIVLIKDDLRNVVLTIELGKKTLSKIKQNLFWAFVYNALMIPIAAGVLYPLLINPTISAVAMTLSSITVVGNSILLKRFKPEMLNFFQ